MRSLQIIVSCITVQMVVLGTVIVVLTEHIIVRLTDKAVAALNVLYQNVDLFKDTPIVPQSLQGTVVKSIT